MAPLQDVRPALHSGTYLVIFAVPLLRKPALGGFEAHEKPMRWSATLPTRLFVERLRQLHLREARRQGRHIAPPARFALRLTAFGWPAIGERILSFDLVTQTRTSSHRRRVIS